MADPRMIRVNILTPGHAAESLIMTPLFVNRRLLRDAGVTFRVFYEEGPALHQADCVIVDGRFYRRWQDGDRRQGVAGLLSRLRENVEKVFWFDTTDGTGTTQFQFLPYVDKYLKIQALRDRRLYMKSFYGGRIYTDYYHREFGVVDSDEVGPFDTAGESDLHKIEVAWGHSLADFGTLAPMLRKLRTRLPLPAFYSQRFVRPGERSVAASFRYGTGYGRETVAFQRKLVQKKARELGYETDKIPRARYLKELKQAKVAVSPFGWGEASYKDYEVILNGAAMVKPEMSHMETWPELYVAGETYLPFDWECSDLEQVLDRALERDRWRDVALRAQELYRRHISERAGREEFASRFRDLVVSVATAGQHASTPGGRSGPATVGEGREDREASP